MLRIFIGYDPRETVALHVLSYSIQQRSTVPVAITPIDRRHLQGILTRPRGEYDSTDFSISRFLVPFLCDYEGWAVFMDCDMLCLGDVREFAGYASLADKYGVAVRVVKHDYTPNDKTKFLGESQLAYYRKNWSSVMVFNNTLCRRLTPDYVNKAPGLELHRFSWLEDWQIGSLPKPWNHLVGEANQCAPEEAKLAHFTNGGPWFVDDKYMPFAPAWHSAKEAMNESDST